MASKKAEDTGGGSSGRGGSFSGGSPGGGGGGGEAPHVRDQESGGGSKTPYADKLKMNVRRAERFQRNVLEITLETDPGVKVEVDPNTVVKLLNKLGINKNMCQGIQPCPGFSRKIFVWLKDGINLDQFCKDESFVVAEGIKTGAIRPMGRREVSVLIRGLNFQTPDSLVREYLGKHGKVVSEKVIYEKEKDKSHPYEGLYIGNRRYLVDFTQGRNLGSYHIIDGFKVEVTYAGQQRTCWRCHQTSRDCPGRGLARQCEDRRGPRVSLIDHMRSYWEKIGFSPAEFELNSEEVDENRTEDMEIKDSNRFTPPRKTAQMNSQEILKGVSVRNLPNFDDDEELVDFLESKGLPENHNSIKIHK